MLAGDLGTTGTLIQSFIFGVQFKEVLEALLDDDKDMWVQLHWGRCFRLVRWRQGSHD